MSIITHTSPQYYAVIFTSIRTDSQAYVAIANTVLEEAKKQDGFLGIESARNDIGISVSYWRDLQSIEAWKNEALHKKAQQRAKEFYEHFRVRVCKKEPLKTRFDAIRTKSYIIGKIAQSSSPIFCKLRNAFYRLLPSRLVAEDTFKTLGTKL
ncbi:antibiotic biosynthesis monooxygenase [Sulfuricurvum sp. MLSB]|uniref:antibiotic biosynthesis monooxygenase family protein n=1 Tax=Sulfuricurvum sp. MLSB TaxID=1537917 RepID=UPI0025E9D437|nr:antibiotic biosynthesis monooxygenase [Sulfuricurvum sp. MLSB]